MLPQTARLRKTSDFKEVFGKGKGVRDNHLFLKSATARNEGVRFGIVVSKQVAAKAVERNRIKRLLRQALQDFLPLLKPGHDVVLVTLPGFAAANLKDAKLQVMSIITKSFLLKP